MSKHYSKVTTEVDAVESTAAVNVQNLDPVAVTVYETTATWNGTYNIQVSMDGTNFANGTDIHGNSLAAKTAVPFSAQLPAGVHSVRLDCSVWTAGGATMDIGGIDKTLRS